MNTSINQAPTSLPGICRRWVCGLVYLWLCTGLRETYAEDRVVKPLRELVTAESQDQDDMCFWVHPTQPELSVIITSDKSANQVFVYDLGGKLLQQVPVAKPGNIDIRQGVVFGGSRQDLVVVNQRSDGFKLRVFRVDPRLRQLQQLDRGELLTGPNYGGCLYLSRLSGKLSFLCTSDAGSVEQHDITVNEQGVASSKLLRKWDLGKCEGAVADDVTGTFFISEERRGIWKVGAEPGGTTPGELILRVGPDHDLTGDLEGLTLYRPAENQGCLIVSDQQSHRFVAFQLQAPHRRLSQFQVTGVSATDGIDVCPVPLGKDFPEGVFACHNDQGRRAIQLSSLATIRPWIESSTSKR